MTQSDIGSDVTIVGGGVAGSALGAVLARAGVDVVIVERERTFRDRVRGDALFPWGTAIFSRLGLADALPLSGSRPLPIWQTYDDRVANEPYCWADDVPTGDALWGVNHPGLQQALIEAAAAAGARVLRPAKASSVSRNTDGTLATRVNGYLGEHWVHSRLVVGADGRESGVRAWIGATVARDPVHHVIGGCLVSGVDLAEDASHLGRLPGGMALVFRHADERARLYLVCSPEIGRALRGHNNFAAFADHCSQGFPEGAFARIAAHGPVAFFPAADIASSSVAGEGIVLLGDAAAANDPSLGQGLAIAMRDVQELAEALLGKSDWQAAIAGYAARRRTWYDPLRAYAAWVGPLNTDIGDDADAARGRARRAQDADFWRDGYGAIFALGPEGLPVTEEARRHFLGLDLEG